MKLCIDDDTAPEDLCPSTTQPSPLQKVTVTSSTSYEWANARISHPSTKTGVGEKKEGGALWIGPHAVENAGTATAPVFDVPTL